MDQPIRPKRHHRDLPAVRVPVPGSPRHAYEVRLPRFVVVLQGASYTMGYHDRETVALRNSLEGAMESAVILASTEPDRAITA